MHKPDLTEAFQLAEGHEEMVNEVGEMYDHQREFWELWEMEEGNGYFYDDYLEYLEYRK